MQPRQEILIMKNKMKEQINAKIIPRFICTKTLHFTGERTEVQSSHI